MSNRCIITNKKTSFGKSVTMRGIAKKKKGIGLKMTSSSRRSFKVNSIRKRVWSESKKRYFTVRVSAKGLKMMDSLDVADLV